MRQSPLSVAIVLIATSGAVAADEIGDPQAGFDYAKRVCSACHSISAEKSPLAKAPRFREVADLSPPEGASTSDRAIEKEPRHGYQGHKILVLTHVTSKRLSAIASLERQNFPVVSRTTGKCETETGSPMTASTAKHFDWLESFLSVPKHAAESDRRFECSGHHTETAQFSNAAWVQPSFWR